MTTYRFNRLDYFGAVTLNADFSAPPKDAIVFDRSLSAADLGLYSTADARGLKLVAGDKVCVLLETQGERLRLQDLSSELFRFEDGSQVLFANRFNDDDDGFNGYDQTLNGTVHDDLLIGTHAALTNAFTRLAPFSGIAGDAISGISSLSADGRWVVFSSAANGLSTRDANGNSDIYRRDLVTGTTTLVSTSSDGPPWEGDSAAPAVSADGSVVAYLARSSDLNEGGGFIALVVDDLKDAAGPVVLNRGPNEQAPNGGPYGPALSSDGKHVAFVTEATNLIDGEARIKNIYYRDLSDGLGTDLDAMQLVSANSNGEMGNSTSGRPSISGNGQFVVFHSDANNLVAGDTNGAEVYLRDMVAGTTVLVSQYQSGGATVRATGRSYNPVISDDGKHVAFQSYDTFGLFVETGTEKLNVFVKNLDTGVVELASVNNAGTARGGFFGLSGSLAGTSDASPLAISGNGRYVVFLSLATHLVHDDQDNITPDPAKHHRDLFVRDMETNEITRVREHSNGNFDEGQYSTPSISDDGSRISFARSLTGLGQSVKWETCVVDNPLYEDVVKLAGGDGNDSYQIARDGDVIEEFVDAGVDTVRASVTHTLARNLEILTLTGTAGINGTGNSEANVISGNVGDNRLDGGTGRDTVSYASAIGPVRVRLDTPGRPQETQAAGTDTLWRFENLTGSDFNDALIGNASNNVLNGGAGADVISGLKGDDVYRVDNVGDRIVEKLNCGTDTVRSTVSYTLSANVEVLQLDGDGRLDGTGNAEANVLRGNDGRNVLDGAAGADRLTGGAGRDIFVLGDLGRADTLTDFESGVDRVRFDAKTLRIGDKDSTLDGAVTRLAPGGFADSAELVVFVDAISGGFSTGKAAAAIGRASSSYAEGQRTVFVVDNGEDTALYLFTSSASDGRVSAEELTLLATLQSTTTVDDYFFGG